MTGQILLLAAFGVLTTPSPAEQGSIRGIVLNASRAGQPARDTEVVLTVRQGSELVPVTTTRTDAQGRFLFEGLARDADLVYQAGANCNGVHYPGPRLRLDSKQPCVELELVIHEAVAEPSPLIAERHEIVIRPEAGKLTVTESMRINNPTSHTFVGQAAHEGGMPVTLRLSIPEDFIKVTFRNEFFGRRFQAVNGKLVTGIPWPPGARDLVFTYIVPNEDKYRILRRPLDLPSSQVEARVSGLDAKEVSCNLAHAESTATDGVRFVSPLATLPAEHVIQIEFGKLPVPVLAHARWFALGILVLLIAASAVALNLRRFRRTVTGSPAKELPRPDKRRSRHRVAAISAKG